MGTMIPPHECLGECDACHRWFDGSCEIPPIEEGDYEE